MTAAHDHDDHDYDIVMMTDCRFPGGTVSSVVEEIIAQTRAGYRTGLIHFPSSVLTYPRPFNPKIRRCIETGMVELIVGDPEVHTRLVLMRHPSIFSTIPETAPRIVSEERVLAVNQVPEDDRGEERYYDIPAIADNLDTFLGGDVAWAPIGPRVRESLTPYASRIPVHDRDWENIVDVDAWTVERDGFVADRPVLGRHSRGHWTKWPEDPDEIRAAWPVTEDHLVKVLGGTRPPERILGGLPPNWISYPFNSLSPQEFLAEIDFLVYYHHPGLIEAFGRVVLEGLAAGAVPVVAPYFEELFDDACLYGEPADVRDHVASLYGDWEAYSKQSQRGVELARRRFSYDTHVARIRELIGEPDGTSRDDGPAAAASPTPSGPVVLFVDADDGARTDHVLSLTRRSDATRLALLTSPTAAIAARERRLATEVIGGPTELGLDRSEWEMRLSERISRLMEAHKPRTVVLAGSRLPPGLSASAKANPDVRFVWLTPGPTPPEEQIAAVDLTVDLTALDTASEEDVRTTMAAIAAPTDATARDLVRELPWASVDPAATDGSETRHTEGPDGTRSPTDTSGREPPADAPTDRVRRIKSRIGERLPRLRYYLWRSRAWRRRLRVELRRWQRQVLKRIETRAHEARIARRERGEVVEGIRPDVPGGDVVRPSDVADAPAVLIVLWDVAAADLPALVHRIAIVQQMTSEFRPVFVTTRTDTSAFRRYGYLSERILSTREWRLLHGDAGWEDYAHGRLRELARAYQPGHVAMLDGAEGVDRLDVQRLSQLLRPLNGS